MKVKKLVSILLAGIIMFALCGCSMSKNQIRGVLDSVQRVDYLYKIGDDFRKAKESKKFKSIVLERLQEYLDSSDYDKAYKLMSALDYYGFRDEDVNNLFEPLALQKMSEQSDFNSLCEFIQSLVAVGYSGEAVKKEFLTSLSLQREIIFTKDGIDSLPDYLEAFLQIKGESFAKTIDFFPYDQTVSAIKTYAEPVICEAGNGGYYDTHSGLNKDDDYWYSPLFGDTKRHKEIGYQHITKENLYAGDFDVYLRQTVMYGTKASDKGVGNSVTASLFYKDNGISGSYETFRDFLSLCKTGNTYYCGDGDRSDAFFILEEGKVTVLYGGDLFSVVYT